MMKIKHYVFTVKKEISVLFVFVNLTISNRHEKKDFISG